MNFRNKALQALGDERRVTLLNQEDGRFYVEDRQDAEPIVEFVKQRAQMPDDKDFRYLGEMPKATVNQALAEGWLDDPKRVRQWFRENPKFSAAWTRGGDL